MNIQDPGIEWTHPYGRKGYTNNYISGCKHNCVWHMPDGVPITCYARRIAENLATKSYAEGFESHYVRESELDEIRALTEPSGIFLSSMGDLFGAQVPYEDIDKLMAVCKECSQHIFFVLTKDPARMFQYFFNHWSDGPFPTNVWLGVSMPADEMNGVRLSPEQKEVWLAQVMRKFYNLRKFYGITTWMSFEPLSWDCGLTIAGFPDSLDWAVIGAASAGKKYYRPDKEFLITLQAALDEAHVPVFHKGNLRPFLQEWDMPIREEYPPERMS